MVVFSLFNRYKCPIQNNVDAVSLSILYRKVFPQHPPVWYQHHNVGGSPHIVHRANTTYSLPGVNAQVSIEYCSNFSGIASPRSDIYFTLILCEVLLIRFVLNVQDMHDNYLPTILSSHKGIYKLSCSKERAQQKRNIFFRKRNCANKQRFISLFGVGCFYRLSLKIEN